MYRCSFPQVIRQLQQYSSTLICAPCSNGIRPKKPLPCSGRTTKGFQFPSVLLVGHKYTHFPTVSAGCVQCSVEPVLRSLALCLLCVLYREDGSAEGGTALSRSHTPMGVLDDIAEVRARPISILRSEPCMYCCTMFFEGFCAFN